MKQKWIWLLALLSISASVLSMEDQPGGVPSRETRCPGSYENQRRRCYEIMVLLQTYRMISENGREPIRAQIMKRLREDCLENKVELDRTIAVLRRRLDRLQQEAATPVDQRVEREFDRLLKLMDAGRVPPCLQNLRTGDKHGGRNEAVQPGTGESSACSSCRMRSGCKKSHANASDSKTECEFGKKICDGKINH